MRKSVAELAPLIRSRRMMLTDGWTERTLQSAVKTKRLHVVRRGWYIEGEEWNGFWPEERHRALVIAATRDARTDAPVCRTSAAVLFDLPFYHLDPRWVHFICGPDSRNSSRGDVKRHPEPLGPFDTEIIDGIRCTTLSRTVFDLIRVLPLEAAVAVADAAERQMAQRGREWDLDAVESWRMGLAERIAERPGIRGIAQARWVAEFADGRAQLPGESVSRLQLHRLGFAPPRLQVPVPGPHGNTFFVDFGLDDADSFGEFDGETKYRDKAKRNGKSIDDVLIDEKEREDWIRGTTGRGFVRWKSPHILTARTLGQRLAAFGVRAP
ncbi:hypothetical protein ACFVAE_15670 [Microbacterium sp. NPDC057659]|uniref:hypothetical protein n=1 Tax=Microbacterium sp. NPDC057659 TaxID=3346198 RepID=UPI00366CBAF3